MTFNLFKSQSLYNTFFINTIKIIGTNYGTAANATVKPVLTISVDGKGNEVIYDDAADIAGKTITCVLDVPNFTLIQYNKNLIF